MATTNAISLRNMFEKQNSRVSINNEIERQELEAAVAKGMELRAVHAALLQGTSPAAVNLYHHFPSPVTHLPAHDYPIFTPSCEDEESPAYAHKITRKNRTISENFDEYNLERLVFSSDYRNTAARKGSTHVSPISSRNSVPLLPKSPGIDIFKSGQIGNKSTRSSNVVFPLTDSHSRLQTRNKGFLSSFFPRLKKKNKNKNGNGNDTPTISEFERFSQVFGTVSVAKLKRELIEANQTRDAALVEVAEMRSSFGDLTTKLECLESYCQKLKKALKQEKIGRNQNSKFPVSHEVMLNCFLQIVAESRLSLRRFCKTLFQEFQETNDSGYLSSLLNQHKLAINSKYSKPIRFKLESMVNQNLYQDFENSMFLKNGTPKFLNPNQAREARFSSFSSLRNLRWDEVLRKGTKYHSEELSEFCDRKMSLVIASLSWTKSWSEELLQSFFIAAKCVWLLHLLAFSFDPAVGILRVEENRSFDPIYMENVLVGEKGLRSPCSVRTMVMPGFYVLDRVIKCKVVCK